jgi:EmrB/QacA subfamily drug resistance transporter
LEKAESSRLAGIDYNVKWFVLAAVGMGVFLATIDGSIVNIALPTLVEAFDTNFPSVQWVVLAYLLTITTLMLSVGRLADMIGKKSIYASGFVIFTLGSALCGISPSVYWLIAFRVFQAVGAAMIMALGTAIVTEAFPPQERGKALGITGSIVSVGIVIGPTIGGLLIQSLSWNWIFYVNLPVGILGIWMVMRYVPAIRPASRQRFDILGALTLFASLLCLLLALTNGQERGFTSLPILIMFALSAILLAVFIYIELHSQQPMIDLSLFRNRLFSTNLATAILTFIAFSGVIILMPFYLENVLGYSPRQAGLLLVTVPVMLGISSPISGVLSDRMGTRLIGSIGLAIILAGYIGVSTLSAETTSLGYILRFIPVGLGFGIFQSPNNSAIMGAAPRERLGIVSGMLAISRTLGQTTGIALMGAIWASRVLHYAGEAVPGGATQAAPAYQVAALQDTFLVVIGILSLALLLSLISLYTEKRERE